MKSKETSLELNADMSFFTNFIKKEEKEYKEESLESIGINICSDNPSNPNKSEHFRIFPSKSEQIRITPRKSEYFRINPSKTS